MERHTIVLAHPDATLVHPWPIRAVSAGDCHQGSARTFWFLLCLQDIHLLTPNPLSPGGRGSPGETPPTKAIPTAEPKIPLPTTTHRQREKQHNVSDAGASAQPCLGRPAVLQNPGVTFLLLISAWKLGARLSSFPPCTLSCIQWWLAAAGSTHSTAGTLRKGFCTLFLSPVHQDGNKDLV